MKNLSDRIAVLIILILIIIGSLIQFQRIGSFITAEMDCVGYYSYLRSAMIDRDLNLDNDFELYGLKSRRNVWTVGPAILWIPAFAAAHSFSRMLNLLGIPVPLNGVSSIYEFFIVLESMGLGLTGLLFIYYFLRLFFSTASSFFSLLFLFCASPLIFYQFQEPLMSHILTVFIVSLFLYYWYKTWQKKTVRDWILLGIAAGFIILIRPQDIFFFVIPVAAEYWSGKNWRGPAYLFLTAFICFIPQMLAWKIIYNHYLIIPQGGPFMRWFNPQIFPVLFSTNHGLITYTPIIALCLAGLFFYDKKDQKQTILFIVFLLIFLAELYVNAAAEDWWAGQAFGARRFLSCSIIFAWGLGNLFEKSREKWRVIALICILLSIFNLLLYSQWIHGLIPRSGDLTFTHFLPK